MEMRRADAASIMVGELQPLADPNCSSAGAGSLSGIWHGHHEEGRFREA